MPFVKFKQRWCDSPLWLRAEKVVAVVGVIDNDPHATVRTEGDGFWVVDATPDEVMAAIEAALAERG